MNETEFVKLGTDDWVRLRYLATKVEHSPSHLSTEEMEEFLHLYRKTSADLARARAETSNPELIESLNDVLGLAYAALYRKPASGLRHSIHGILAAGARAFRRQFRFVLMSLATLVLGSLIASATLHFRPDLRPHLVSSEMEALFDRWKTGQFEERTSSDAIIMTGFYASNNPRVALTTAAIGASTLGTGSFYILYMNGALLGSLGHDMAKVGKLGFLLTSIAPHGATELSGAIIAGAGGYSLGWAVIAPGRRRRLDSLRVKGKDALTLLAMGVIMMYLAAPFEGFFSFNPAVPQWLKGLAGLVIFLIWCAYWAFYGRKDEHLANAELETFLEEETTLATSRRSSVATG